MSSSIAKVAKPALTRPSNERLLALRQLQCSIFSTTFNPNSIRTGAKYLKARTRGQTLVAYYPPKDLTFKNVRRMFPELGLVDLDERQRIADLAARKARGKGPPPKANSKGKTLPRRFLLSDLVARGEPTCDEEEAIDALKCCWSILLLSLLREPTSLVAYRCGQAGRRLRRSLFCILTTRPYHKTRLGNRMVVDFLLRTPSESTTCERRRWLAHARNIWGYAGITLCTPLEVDEVLDNLAFSRQRGADFSVLLTLSTTPPVKN